MTPEPAAGYDRARLVDVLIYHWRRDDSGCGCGWGDDPSTLGKSWPEHVANVYEDRLDASRAPS